MNKIQSSKLSDAACPVGFVVLTAAFEKAVETHLEELRELQEHLDAESANEHKVEELLRGLGKAMLKAPLPRYRELCSSLLCCRRRLCCERFRGPLRVQASCAVEAGDFAGSGAGGVGFRSLSEPPGGFACLCCYLLAGSLAPVLERFHIFLKLTSNFLILHQHMRTQTIRSFRV